MEVVVAWLNANSVVVQAVATLALVAITAIYVILTFKLAKAASIQATATQELLRITKENTIMGVAQPLARVLHEARSLYRHEDEPKPESRSFITDALTFLPTTQALALLRAAATASGSEEVIKSAETLCENVESARTYLTRLRSMGSPPDRVQWKSVRDAIDHEADHLIDKCTALVTRHALNVEFNQRVPRGSA